MPQLDPCAATRQCSQINYVGKISFGPQILNWPYKTCIVCTTSQINLHHLFFIITIGHYSLCRNTQMQPYCQRMKRFLDQTRAFLGSLWLSAWSSLSPSTPSGLLWQCCNCLPDICKMKTNFSDIRDIMNLYVWLKHNKIIELFENYTVVNEYWVIYYTGSSWGLWPNFMHILPSEHSLSPWSHFIFADLQLDHGPCGSIVFSTENLSSQGHLYMQNVLFVLDQWKVGLFKVLQLINFEKCSFFKMRGAGLVLSISLSLVLECIESSRL